MKPTEIMEILGCDAEMRQDLLRLLPDAVWEPSNNLNNHRIQEITTLRITKADEPAGR
jgi:hypothetical protein